MKPQKWLVLFIVFSIVGVTCIAIFNLVLNPYKIFYSPFSVEFSSDRNGRFAKLDKLKKSHGVHTLIAGSSRSEFIFPEDMKNKSFSTSVGGIVGYSRYAFAMKGLEKMKSLKEIWYFSDFYEFNQKEIPWHLIGLRDFQPYFSNKIFDSVRPSQFVIFKELVSLRTLGASLKTLKEIRKGKKLIYLENGRTTRPVTMSNSLEFEKQLDRSLLQYQNQEWKNYTQLSDLSIKMLQDLKVACQKNDVVLRIILTPFHSYVLNYVKANKELYGIWQQWRDFLASLEGRGVEVIDLNEIQLFSGEAKFWEDGVHFNREASKRIIKYLEK